jgi:hypothetical protein
MHKFFIIVLTVSATFVFSQTAQAAAKGQIVAAKWGGSSWYLAMITNVNGTSYDVVYADGDAKQALPESELKPIPEDPQIKVGDKVLAVWSNAVFYPGTVTSAANLSYEVKWDDGTGTKWVPAGRILKQ